MWHAPQGVHDLLRALYHFKSADWKGNKLFVLKSWTASELARMPAYYIMDLDKGIAETMATEMPSRAQIAACEWLTDEDLQVYGTEYIRTGFQGGLNAYRILANPQYSVGLKSFSGRTIDVPSVSSPVPVTGAPFKPRARWKRCVKAHARACWVFIWSRERVTRSPKNSRSTSTGY